MPSVSSVTPTGNPYIDGVLSGLKWGVSSFTYSFPTSASFYTGANGTSYGNGEENSGFKAFTAVQQAAVTSILSMYSMVANVTFTQITETSTQSADLRYAESNVPSTAWAYYPSTSPEGGDAWFNNSTGWYNNPVVGNYAWLTMIHETGHIMGLKHPQDVMGSFSSMPVDHDSLEYSVMSYRSYIGASTTQGLTNATWSFPQTLMMYDIAALQDMYGANYSTNGGNTVYRWNPSTGQESINGVAQAAPGGNTIFMTIWDGGGNDTYDFSNYTTNLSVNLQPGAWTTVSTAELANLGAGHTAVGNIANALLYNNSTASLIENAVGGSGNDTIVGNAADNNLTGGAGNDFLDGVSGSDTAVYSGPSTAYQVTQNANGTWTVMDLRTGSPDGTDTLKNISLLQFSDTTIPIATIIAPPVIQAPVISSISPDSGSVGDGITSANVLTLTGTAQANMTINVYDGLTLVGTVVANANGGWSLPTGTLPDGTHNFTATATDSQGHISTASTATNVIVDTVAPVVPTIAMQSVDSGLAGDGITNVNIVSLTGVAEINSTVKVYDGATLLGSATANAEGVWNFVADLSNDQILPQAGDITGSTGSSTADATGVNQAQAWGFTTQALPDGVHNFTVTSTDAAGNVSTAAALNVTVDTTAPVAPTITSFSNDTGVAGDGITNDMTLALSGKAEANAAVKIFDGTTYLNTVTADSNGNWNYTTGTLGNGPHSLTATATDVAGNTSVVSTPLNVTVDAIAPVVTQITASPGTGLEFPGDTVVLTVNLSEAVTVTGTPTLSLNDGGTAIYTGGSNTNTLTFSYTVGATDSNVSALAVTGVNFPNGATVTDVAGNVANLSGALTTFTGLQIDPPTGPVTTKSYNADGTLHEVTVTGITGQKWTSTDTLYANGKAVSEVWSNGATVVQTETWNSDGTVHDIHYYGLTGAYTDYDVVYANNKPVSATYSNGMTATWTYNSDGSLHELVYNGIAGQRYTSTDTLYANGKAVSEVWSNGATVVQTETWNSDGTVHDVHYYGLTGAYTDYDVVYANNKPVSATYSNGMTATWTYNSDGSLHELVYNGIAGQRYTSTDTLYANGKAVSEVWSNGATVVQTETWNSDGTVHDVHYYGLTGAYTDYDVVYANNKPVSATYSNGMTATWSYNSDGSLHELVYNGIAGQRYTSTDTLYANGKAVSEVWSNGATVVQTETWNSDGTVHDVHYYGLTGAYTDYDVVYANNKPVSATYSNGMTATWSYNSDGSLHELVYNGIAGQRYTSTDTLYANGKAVSEVWSNGATVVQTETWNSDGTVHDIHYYGLTGAYTDYDVVYANNKPVSATYSNGMTATWTYNSDGSLHELVYNGIAGQRYTSTDTLYANGKAVSEVWSNGATVVQTETWNPDGTVHDVHYYGLTGAYTDYDVVYASNKPVSATYSNGMTATWTYNSDGSLHELVYNGIAGQRYTSTDTLYANGKAVSEVWSNGATVVQTETWNPDGTVHDVHYYGITRQPYTDYDVVYANNKPVSATYSNGMTETWAYNTDGSVHEIVFNGITGQRYTSTDTLYANGKAVSEVWSNGATVVQTETWNPDGTVHDVHYYGLTGAYTDYDVVYANNKPVSASFSNGMTEAWSYNADGTSETSLANVQGSSYTSFSSIYDPHSSTSGHLAAQEYVGTNGTQNIHGYENGLTISVNGAGANVNLPAPAGDNFSFAFHSNTVVTGGGANENFVLQSGFGNVTITDFVANSLANTNHDVITFAGNLFTSFTDVMNHATQDRLGNTVIADGHGDTLTLNHTVLASLHPNDFLLA